MDPWDKLDEMMDITVPEQIAQAVAAERKRCEGEIKKLRGHKEEADRHIATIAQLRAELAAERERCARLCDAAREREERNGPNLDGYHMALMLGAAIREGE
jgi:hypothetical protein